MEKRFYDPNQSIEEDAQEMQEFPRKKYEGDEKKTDKSREQKKPTEGEEERSRYPE